MIDRVALRVLRVLDPSLHAGRRVARGRRAPT